MLKRMGYPRIILDSRPIYEAETVIPCKKPNLPVSFELTADIAFVRFISNPEKNQNIKYAKEWAQIIQTYLKNEVQVYFFVHCPQEEHTPEMTKFLYEIFT